jgi:hypothetical protein
MTHRSSIALVLGLCWFATGAAAGHHDAKRKADCPCWKNQGDLFLALVDGGGVWGEEGTCFAQRGPDGTSTLVGHIDTGTGATADVSWTSETRQGSCELLTQQLQSTKPVDRGEAAACIQDIVAVGNGFFASTGNFDEQVPSVGCPVRALPDCPCYDARTVRDSSETSCERAETYTRSEPAQRFRVLAISDSNFCQDTQVDVEPRPLTRFGEAAACNLVLEAVFGCTEP